MTCQLNDIPFRELFLIVGDRLIDIPGRNSIKLSYIAIKQNSRPPDLNDSILQIFKFNDWVHALVILV